METVKLSQRVLLTYPEVWEARLAEKGMTVQVEAEPADDAIGKVLSQSPESGTRIPEGSQVTIVIAANRILPEVVGMSQEEAEKKIKKLGGYNRLYRIKLEADYLAKLTWEGAKERYGDPLTDEQKERIIFELHVMKTMGFPGYFLIVSDYIRAAREELGVSVGPGRGSAAGSVVAYCLKITDLDPLTYDLLFERFLNPDRIS